MKAPCRHTEGFRLEEPPRSPVHAAFHSGGRPLPPPTDAHDCGYVNARNNLIPEAERIATAAVLKKGLTLAEPAGKAWFSREFLGAMQRLAVQEGLTS